MLVKADIVLNQEFLVEKFHFRKSEFKTYSFSELFNFHDINNVKAVRKII
jgi:hypothetical protein